LKRSKERKKERRKVLLECGTSIKLERSIYIPIHENRKRTEQQRTIETNEYTSKEKIKKKRIFEYVCINIFQCEASSRFVVRLRSNENDSHERSPPPLIDILSARLNRGTTSEKQKKETARDGKS
jgi:hypothetical protein